jgi:acetylglutamate kinase
MSRGPLVVKIGGAGVDDPLRAAPLWQALADAHAVLQGKLVLVHGGGRAVDAHLDRLNCTTERRGGIRITPEDQIGEIVAVLAGRVNKALVGAIHATTSLSAVGLSLGDGRSVHTMKAEHYGFDPGRVGVVTGGRPELLNALTAGGFLPVLCTIGLDDDGRPLNINGDDGAAGIAAVLGARGLVLLTDVPGVLDDHGQLIDRLTGPDITTLIQRGTIKGGMIPKATAAARAADSAGAPATIASWNNPHDLIRIARGEPAGTTIVPA